MHANWKSFNTGGKPWSQNPRNRRGYPSSSGGNMTTNYRKHNKLLETRKSISKMNRVFQFHNLLTLGHNLYPEYRTFEGHRKNKTKLFSESLFIKEFNVKRFYILFLFTWWIYLLSSILLVALINSLTVDYSKSSNLSMSPLKIIFECQPF